MLYPSLLQPLLGSLWSQPTPKTPTPTSSSSSPPRNMHPGMRMQQSHQPILDQTGQSTTGSRGPVYSWMLPLYTVGVVVFLLYTLFKILFKSKKKKNKRRSLQTRLSSDDEEEEGEGEDNEGNMSRKQLRSLQMRLKQTEQAMAKILEQLEQVHKGDVPIPSSNLDNTDQNLLHQPSPPDTAYIKDLEKALKDFKDLSQDYNGRRQQKRHEREDSEDSANGEEEEEEETESEEDRSSPKDEVEEDRSPLKDEAEVDRSSPKNESEDEQVRRRR